MFILPFPKAPYCRNFQQNTYKIFIYLFQKNGISILVEFLYLQAGITKFLLVFLGEKKLRRKTTLKGDIMRARYCIQCTWVMLFFSDIQNIFFRQKRIYYIIYNYCTIDVYNCTFWINYTVHILCIVYRALQSFGKIVIEL